MALWLAKVLANYITERPLFMNPKGKVNRRLTVLASRAAIRIEPIGIIGVGNPITMHLTH